MESEDEPLRLDLKTNEKTVMEQALWAGIKPGMRVADLGFGSGKTTYLLHKLVQPNGRIVGVDFAKNRIEYAEKHYSNESIEYIYGDIREPLDNIGMFDFIWVRFVLEYYKSNSFDIVKNISNILKPGGIIQLIDLDHNCLCHYGMPERLEKTLFELVNIVQIKKNFDPYVGRKLYSYLFDLGFNNLEVNMVPHHLIYGKLNKVDEFNWTQKARVGAKQLGHEFKSYPGGYDEFYDEFMTFFKNPRRLTYTPLISCRGQKPVT